MPILGKNQLGAAGLDGLGTKDWGDANDLTNTAKVLVDMAYNIISEAQKNLNRSGSTATGELESSMSISDIAINGSRMSCDVLIADRWEFTDQGVNGVEVNRGSKFSFKTKHPNKKMATALLKWVRKRGIRGQLAAKYRPISKTETKDVKVTPKTDNLKGMAYAMATNIKKKGIKPTKFFTKAIQSTEQKFADAIAEGVKLDIINSL